MYLLLLLLTVFLNLRSLIDILNAVSLLILTAVSQATVYICHIYYLSTFLLMDNEKYILPKRSTNNKKMNTFALVALNTICKNTSR